MNGIPNPTGEKTNHQWERREGEGEMEKETERAREPLKRCAHKATKHLGTCRARQVEIETKLPLSLPAGGWLGAKGFERGGIYIGSSPIY